MDYSKFINETSALRTPSALRELTIIQSKANPELISFGTGAPNPCTFPFESICAVNRADGYKIQLTDKKLSSSLQYTPTSGFPAFIPDVQQILSYLHMNNRPITTAHSAKNDSDASFLITPGSQDGMAKTFEAILSKGDSVLIENPSYPGTILLFRALQVHMFPVECDADGLNPVSLQEQLRNCKMQGLPTPKLLYVQPNCSNPTGISTTFERRRRIYDLASEHDFLIVEDDPYYFINFAELQDVPPSFFSMDADGRVLRLDSFSKIISAGLRVGVLSGPKILVDRVEMHLQVTSAHCSSLSQMLIHSLFEYWGIDGFLQHCRNVAKFYSNQCDAILKAAELHLSDVASWNKPSGGMFLWLKANGISDTTELITKKALERNVLLAPGQAFLVNQFEKSSCMRASFSLANPEQMEEGFKRLGMLLREEVSRLC